MTGKKKTARKASGAPPRTPTVSDGAVKPRPAAASVTIGDLQRFQDELRKKYGADECIGYPSVKFTQLSIARYYGCANVNGKMFIYNPLDDSLIRDDVVAFVKTLMKKEAACQAKQKPKRSRTKTK